MKNSTKFIGLTFVAMSLFACERMGSDVASIGTPTREEVLNDAIEQIVSPQESITNCSNADGSCDAEVAALVESVYSNLSGLVEVTYEDIKISIEYGVDYATGLSDTLSEFNIVYIPPHTPLDRPIDISQVSIPRPDRISPGAITPMLNDNAGIPADEEKATRAPNDEAGWYYRNTENAKVNWYFYGDFGDYDASYNIRDLQSLTANVTHYNTSGYYFINVYTQPEGDGKDRSSWYRSRLNLVVDRSGVVANHTYLGHYERTLAVHDDTGHLPINFSLSSSRLSGASTTLDEINNEQIRLISFSTASGHPEGTEHFLVKELKLGLAGNIISYRPIAFAEPVFPDDSLNGVLGSATSAYMETSSATELFNGLTFIINDEKGSWHITRADGSPLTNAMEVLVQKLDQGNGKNVLRPAVRFNSETTGLKLDIGAALRLADIANLTATIYSDNTKTAVLGTIAIGGDGRTTTVE